MNDLVHFPKSFLWGAATSALQVEGSPLADGAGPSIWHRFARMPGNVSGGATPDRACEHFRLFREDVRLMADLGLTTYRFSIAWGRILPLGSGSVNRAGLDFYERLVDSLLEHDIRPNATLYHWDLPAALDDRGGWLNREISDCFAEYARASARTLGDRVPMWATLNEPWVVMDGGYMRGAHAPGHRSIHEAALAAHNLMRAHGAGVEALRAEGVREVGLVVNIEPKYAASDSDADVAAQRRADAYMNRQFLDAAVHGSYPSELTEIFGEAWPSHSAEDLASIRQPLDWIGVNYYTRSVTRDDPADHPVREGRVRQDRHAHTEMGWEVYAPGLTDTLVWLRDRYGSIPLYVTENGAAFHDPPSANEGAVDDPLRVHYYREHLRAVREAIVRGVDVRGYYAWSLLDNFEWSYGYTKRFGIVHVDFDTQRRTLKTSARFYADVISSNGAVLG